MAVTDGMTPEELQMLFGSENVPDKQKMLAQQLAQAQTLARPSGAQHTTGWGAALGGLGDAIGSIGGAYKGNQIRDQQDALLAQLVKAKMSNQGAEKRYRLGPDGAPMSMNDPAQGGPPSPLALGPGADFSLAG